MVDIIYLRDGRMHTGHIKSSGSELALQLGLVVEDLQNQLGNDNPALSELPVSGLSRLAISDYRIGDRRRRYLKKA